MRRVEFYRTFNFMDKEAIFAALRNIGQGMADQPANATVAQRLGGGAGGFIAGKLKKNDDDGAGIESVGEETDDPNDMKRRKAISTAIMDSSSA